MKIWFFSGSWIYSVKLTIVNFFFFNVITLIIETGMDYTDYTLEIGWNGYLYIVTFHK